MPTRDESGRSRHEDEVKSLTAQISFLDEEIAVLRRRLADSPRQVRLLEERDLRGEALDLVVMPRGKRAVITSGHAPTSFRKQVPPRPYLSAALS